MTARERSTGQRTLAGWLREEMHRQGYALEGPRSGGKTRLAHDAGLSLATISRTLEGQNEPSIDTLRRLAQALGYTLGEVLVSTGLADTGELTVGERVEIEVDPIERRIHADTDLPKGVREELLETYRRNQHEVLELARRIVSRTGAQRHSHEDVS